MKTEVEYVREKLAERRQFGFSDVAAITGVPIKTIRRLANNQHTARADTVGKLAVYFKKRKRRAK